MFADASRTAPQESSAAPVVDGGFGHLQEFGGLVDGEHGWEFDGPVDVVQCGPQFLKRQRRKVGKLSVRHVGHLSGWL